MVKGNLGDSVRSRIDAIVGRQEARDNAEFAKTFDARRKAEPVKVPEVRKNNAEPMKTLDVAKVKQVGEKKPKLPAILFSVLGVVIVGLVIAILVVMKPWENGGDGGGDVGDVEVADKMDGWDGQITADTQALMFSNDIDNKLDTDSDYTVEMAIKDYEDALNAADGELKFQLAIKFAKFAYNTLGDAERAVEILESIQEIAKSSPQNASIYYDLLYTIYENQGDVEKAEYYKGLFEETMNNYWGEDES